MMQTAALAAATSGAAGDCGAAGDWGGERSPATLESGPQVEFTSRMPRRDGRPIAASAPRFSPTRIYAACSAHKDPRGLYGLTAEHAA
jgi:hypothetical protein